MLKINTLRAAIEKANTWCRANPEAWTVFVEEGGIETTGETVSLFSGAVRHELRREH